MSDSFTITVGSPILRPGMTISAEVSEDRVAETYEALLELARTIDDEHEEAVGLVCQWVRYQGDVYSITLRGDDLIGIYRWSDGDLEEIKPHAHHWIWLGGVPCDPPVGRENEGPDVCACQRDDVPRELRDHCVKYGKGACR